MQKNFLVMQNIFKSHLRFSRKKIFLSCNFFLKHANIFKSHAIFFSNWFLRHAKKLFSHAKKNLVMQTFFFNHALLEPNI
jgi:hypothetical protein